jgi:hypothetical protein
MNRKELDIKINPVDSATETIAVMNMGALSHLDRSDIKVDLPKLEKTIKDNIAEIKKGNFEPIEAALYSQALILQDYFIRMLTMSSLSPEPNKTQLYGHLALKAQNQCRATLSAIAGIQHPKKTTFIKQQNNAINQQVSNNNPNEFSQNSSALKNELLTENNHASLDCRRAETSITLNTKLETMAEINGS